MSKNKKNKRKLNIKRVLIALVFFLILVFLFYKILTIRIKNIYISGNEFLSDQEIIDLANLEDYPNSINNLSNKLEKILENNIYILSADVRKKNLLSSVYINIEENYPLFYYSIEEKTILFDGKKDNKTYTIPTVINQIPDTVYDKFIKNMRKVDKDILNRMSEVEYLPNDVDTERFFILMNDGNYVYLTLNKFLTINKYLDMIKSFDNKKGIYI